MVLGPRSPDRERYPPSSVRRLLGLAVIALISACGPRTVPASTPEWQTIGELSQPRAYASAVALSNGKILVVGGENANGPVRDSEAFDPASKTFSAARSWAMKR